MLKITHIEIVSFNTLETKAIFLLSLFISTNSVQNVKGAEVQVS